MYTEKAAKAPLSQQPCHIQPPEPAHATQQQIEKQQWQDQRAQHKQRHHLQYAVDGIIQRLLDGHVGLRIAHLGQLLTKATPAGVTVSQQRCTLLEHLLTLLFDLAQLLTDALIAAAQQRQPVRRVLSGRYLGKGVEALRPIELLLQSRQRLALFADGPAGIALGGDQAAALFVEHGQLTVQRLPCD